MAIITRGELPMVRKKHAHERIVFCSGCFDLTHAGHALFFEDCKRYGDVLVVMVGSDAVLRRDKGETRPIVNEHLRLKMVDSLKPVDYAFLDAVLPDSPPPLYYIDLVLGDLRPDAYVINKDASDIPYREAFSKKHGVPLIVLERTAPPEFESVSTTGIIKRIQSLTS